MLKKTVIGGMLVLLIVVLMAGATIRTLDKTNNVAEARELGQGRGYGQKLAASGEDQGQVRGGNGRGNGGAQLGNGAGLQDPGDASQAEDWISVEGTVVQAPESSGDLVIEMADGQVVAVGAGPGYMEEQGFALQAGETVRVQGYWEAGEFKAAQLTRLRDGQTIILRDQTGRPMWAGSGRRAAELDPTVTQGARGQGGQGQSGSGSQGNGQGGYGSQGNGQGGYGGQGNGQGGYGGQGREATAADMSDPGQAHADAWLTVYGIVASVDADELLIETAGGEEIALEGRPWRFAQEQGFSTRVGDQVMLVGFYEDAELKAGQISDTTSGQTVLIRDESGRPLWAGRGQGE